MNINLEKAYKLSSQERYDIISNAMDAAEDDGFINQFVFIRSLYVFAARVLYPELTEQINTDLLNGSPMIVWDKMLEDGIIDNMVDDYSDELNILADEGQIWLEDFMTYRNSARGIIDVLQIFTEGIAGNMGKQLDMFKNDADIIGIQEMAEKWGLNNNGGALLGN